MGRREEEGEVLGKLGLAVKILEDGMSPLLVPAGGAAIGYAFRSARRSEDVAGVPGGIVKDGGTVRASGEAAFGAASGAARIVLTALRTDPEIRSAIVIRFTPAILATIEDLLLETCEFDRTREPPGVSTMEWGIASCCRDGVPDVVFDRGGPGREGLVRILGDDPVTVAQTVVALSGRLPPEPDAGKRRGPT